MSWFTKKPPKTSIAGMNLTRERTQNLVEMCQLLAKDLHQQTADIQAFPTITGSESFRALSRIQQRHSQVTKRLGDLNLGVSTSTEPWLQEISDANMTMARKVKICNQDSRPFALGWKLAAKQYWPLIADTYTLLIALLARLEEALQTALEDEKTWSEKSTGIIKIVPRPSSVTSGFARKAKSSSETKRVVFEKKVTGRYYHVVDVEDGDGDEDDVDYAATQTSKEFTTNLTNDRKTTAGKYKPRVGSSSAGRRGSGDTLDGVVKGRVYEDTVQDSIAWTHYLE